MKPKLSKRRRSFRTRIERPRIHATAHAWGRAMVNGEKERHIAIMFCEASHLEKHDDDEENPEAHDHVRIELVGPANTRLVALLAFDAFEALVAPILAVPDAPNVLRSSRYP